MSAGMCIHHVMLGTCRCIRHVMLGTQGGQKKSSEFPERELQRISSCLVGARD